MSLHISGDYRDFDAELDRLDGLPDDRAADRLDGALLLAFQQTQAEVHVITGSLKASGRRSSEVEEDEWRGKITYGGPAPGFPNNPVRYAGYERDRGGSHDFLRNADIIAWWMETAITESLGDE